MSHTITVRLTEELSQWLSKTSKRAHLPRGRIVRQQLEKAKAEEGGSFMRLAGALSRDEGLSRRKGFSRR